MSLLFCGRVRTYVLTSVCPSVCPQSSVHTSFLLAGTGVAGSFIVATRPNLVDWPVKNILHYVSLMGTGVSEHFVVVTGLNLADWHVLS